jgi:D-alanyl-lipoteichoic acid acyltransferase DltB (MBOAT superfamily)
MIFNSFEFLIFLAAVFALFWLVPKEKTGLKNWLLLAASYMFYAFASWKILPLLIVSTAVFYALGISVHSAKTDTKKSLLAASGVICALGVLLYFKYANFFITSFGSLFSFIGLKTDLHTLKIIVPVGISFYTFRLLSYIIDIKNGKYEPTRNVAAFFTYVAFFPSILSGPIDRPNTLIPQLLGKCNFDYSLAADGCRQILLGLFKKLVIANNCAIYVNEIYGSFHTQNGSTLLLASILFSFQLYADFAGYSDMAIGVGKLLGFRITHNFNYPFFAQNIAEYWRRWHISLTSWLTDYVFMPLNVKWRNAGKWGMIAAIVLTFLLIGLWHGANWTFALFGLYHGLLYIPLILSGQMFKKSKITVYKWGFPKIKVLGNMLLTFLLATLGNILFRAESMQDVAGFAKHIFSISHHPIPSFVPFLCFLFTGICIFIEWKGKNGVHALEKFGLNWNKTVRRAFYYVLTFIVLWALISQNEQQYIYYQF